MVWYLGHDAIGLLVVRCCVTPEYMLRSQILTTGAVRKGGTLGSGRGRWDLGMLYGNGNVFRLVFRGSLLLLLGRTCTYTKSSAMRGVGW